MIKNSILGKLCPVFHLPSAAVASRQNLNHWLVWSGMVPLCDGEEEHTLVGQSDIEEERRAARGKGGGEQGGGAVENYTTSINHCCTTVFLSSPISRFPVFITFFPLFLSLMAVHLPSLICTPTAPHPDACPPPQLSALYSSPTPWPWALLEAPLVTLSTLHPSQLHFHCGLFTCLLY